MRYLLANHIPATAGRDPAHLVLPAAWTRELTAASRAASERGTLLTVAMPLTQTPSNDGIQVVPDQLGFEHLPLPHYNSARSFLRQRAALEGALSRGMANADVVQLDAGGYPIWLGAIANPIAKAHRRPTLWMLGNELPKSTIRHTAGNAAKRLVGRSLDGRLSRSLLESLRAALCVVCTSETLAEHLRASEGIRVECVESLDVLDSEVATSAQAQARAHRLRDLHRPIRFIVTGQLNVVAGTDRILRALHRCLRLGAACELYVHADGVERSALQALAAELQIESFVHFSAPTHEIEACDVWIDPALTKAAQQSYGQALARGLCPIVCRDTACVGPVVTIAANSVDELSAAMLNAALNRDQTLKRMLAGIDFARTRTLEAAYRRRFELIATLRKDRSAA